MLKTRPQLLEFILNMLSNPWFSSIMSWEGINGQFTIIRPEQAAHLWETGMAEETWPTKSLVGHCVITTTRKCWPRLEAKTTRTSSTFNSLSDTMDIEVDHLSLFISPLANSQYMIPSFAACNFDAFPVSHPTKRFFPQFSTTVWTCRKRIRQIELFSTVNRYTFSASSARFIKSILDKVCLWTEWTFPFGADSLFSSAHCAPDENDRPSDHEQTLNL